LYNPLPPITPSIEKPHKNFLNYNYHSLKANLSKEEVLSNGKTIDEVLYFILRVVKEKKGG